MRSSSSHRRHLMTPEDEGVNIISMLDVALNLLFFFMVGASFERSMSALKVSLPNVSERSLSQVALTDVLRLQVDKSGRFGLGGEMIAPEDLPSRLKAYVEENHITRAIIEADGDAKTQQTLTAMDACNNAGIKEFSIRGEWKKLHAPAASPKSAAVPALPDS